MPKSVDPWEEMKFKLKTEGAKNKAYDVNADGMIDAEKIADLKAYQIHSSKVFQDWKSDSEVTVQYDGEWETLKSITFPSDFKPATVRLYFEEKTTTGETYSETRVRILKNSTVIDTIVCSGNWTAHTYDIDVVAGDKISIQGYWPYGNPKPVVRNFRVLGVNPKITFEDAEIYSK